MQTYKSFPQAYALIIGIAEYEGRARLPDIVTKDANDIADVLIAENYCGYKETNVKLLLNSDATLLNIRSEMKHIASKAKPNDTVFIYFTGHGGNEGDITNPNCFLVPFDFNKSVDNLLYEQELSDLLSNISSDRLLTVIDACHSGGAASFKSSITNYSGIAEKSLERLLKGKGRVLFASSRDSETSLILRGDQNSLFTKHLLSALKGAVNSLDDLIRVFDVFNYLEKNVNNEAEAIGEEQHPILKANIENNFPVALKLGGVKGAQTSSNSENNTSTPDRDKKLEDILADLYPEGPKDQEIWLRAGGDTSRLKFNGSGRSQWYSALRTLKQGGGGASIDLNSLLVEVSEDFPNHSQILQYI